MLSLGVWVVAHRAFSLEDFEQIYAIAMSGGDDCPVRHVDIGQS